MKKVILKVEIHDDKIQRKAMKAVSGLRGVESLLVDRKDKKFTVIGDMDPVLVVKKLKKFFCHVEMVSVGPTKEEKIEERKEEKKGGKEQLAGFVNQIGMTQPCPCPCPCYCYKIVDHNPNGCVIC